MPAAIGKSYGGVMLIVLAVTILQLVIRFMSVATSELLGDVSPIFKNAHVGTFVASILVLILVLTGWWQYLWILVRRGQPIDGLHGIDVGDDLVDV